MLKILHPDIPFKPKSSPIYYGWVSLGVAILGMLFSAPGQTIGFSVFTDSLMVISRLSRIEICTAYFLGTMLSSFLLKRVGRLYDLRGGRLLVVSSALGLAFMLLCFSKLAKFYAFFSQYSLTANFVFSLAFMTFGFFAIRFFGQGVLMLASRNLIGKWFYKRRGMVSAVSGLSVSVGYSLVPPLFFYMLTNYGFSSSYLLLGSGLLGFALFSWVFYRDNPEECGVTLDGNSERDGKPGAIKLDSKSSASKIDSMSLLDAKKTLAFWSSCIGLCLHGMLITAVSFHIVDLGRVAGLDKTEAIALFIPIAFTAGFFDLFTGWLADRFEIKFTLCFMMIGAAIGLAGLSFFSSQVGYVAAVLGLGISTGCFGTLSNLAMPHYFGTKHLGEISGYLLACIVFSTSLGPIFLAASLELFSLYSPALLLASGFALGNAVLALKIEKKRA